MIKRVICGISGGIDSAVSAYILQKKGFEVIGVFMRNWDVANEVGQCSTEEDLRDAENVCKHLGIQFKEVNFIKEYWNNVFSELLWGYENGITPNPDVLCNKHVKFGSFYNYAREHLSADAIATGHYAQNSAGNFLENFGNEKGSYLLKARDSWKDQTLFLCQISQNALQRTMFPVGGILKEETRKIAQQIGLHKMVEKKESTGICFIGSRNFKSFISEYIKPQPGKFINIENGEVVGVHEGTHIWTIGQRCHIGGKRKAFFICSIQRDSPDIYVAEGTDHPALFSSTLHTFPAHWINLAPPDLQSTGHARCFFKFQHVHSLIACDIVGDVDGYLTVSLDQPMRALSPGQYAVFYNNGVCYGGAKIMKSGQSLFELNRPVEYDSNFS